MSLAEQFPPPEGPAPPDPGSQPAMNPKPAHEQSKEEVIADGNAHRAWQAAYTARRKWIIVKRRSIVAKALDEISNPDRAVDSLTPIEAICLTIGISYLDGTMLEGHPQDVFSQLFGAFL